MQTLDYAQIDNEGWRQYLLEVTILLRPGVWGVDRQAGQTSEGSFSEVSKPILSDFCKCILSLQDFFSR